ncbi:MAG: preQ(1) synthase [Bdellovibrionaceae bacterium]|nr:preQ(1) synthase [Pseudobdellovibrionaceae bacterium]MDW8190103.1 preQ(1) synthase [Pseudobdellovibrionaceae bacterium]
MPRSKKELQKLSLGRPTRYDLKNYNPNLLEAITNQHPQKIAWHSFICHEFTSLCPKTGQPDFAKIYINYIPHRLLVESKSLKLYLFSFRNHGDFHEDCVQKICNDLENLIRPRYLEVIGEFTPRGGIAIFPYTQAYAPEKPWKELAQHRLLNYRPGLYSLPALR